MDMPGQEWTPGWESVGLGHFSELKLFLSGYAQCSFLFGEYFHIFFIKETKKILIVERYIQLKNSAKSIINKVASVFPVSTASALSMPEHLGTRREGKGPVPAPWAFQHLPAPAPSSCPDVHVCGSEGRELRLQRRATFVSWLWMEGETSHSLRGRWHGLARGIGVGPFTASRSSRGGLTGGTF